MIFYFIAQIKSQNRQASSKHPDDGNANYTEKSNIPCERFFGGTINATKLRVWQWSYSKPALQIGKASEQGPSEWMTENQENFVPKMGKAVAQTSQSGISTTEIVAQITCKLILRKNENKDNPKE